MNETTQTTPRRRKRAPIETPATPTVHPFKDVRRAGVPLVCYETADPSQTIKNVRVAMNGSEETTPLLQWDCLRGLTGINAPGVALAKDWQADPMTTGMCSGCLAMMFDKSREAKAKDNFAGAVFFFHNSHKFIDDVSVLQGVWNIRDTFEAIGATLVLLATIGNVPLELRNDVVTLTDPLPTPAEISKLARKIADDAAKGGAAVDPAAIEADEVIADTLTGISGFGVRQTFAMSVRKAGVDTEALWERKRKLVEQTRGLQMWRRKTGFESIGGLDRLKRDLTDILTSGNTPVRAIYFWDEIEKMFAGFGGDTSGTSQDQVGVVLKVMQDENIPGIILAGPPGTGKSEVAKGAGGVADAPVITFDFGACKGSLVGESEKSIRAMMEVAQAVSQRKALVIATCNKMAALPPELRRRFKLGTYYVDLPSEKERALIWPVWLSRFKLDTKQPLPPCENWTGAEISACCEIAHRTGRTLAQAAQNIVPVAKSGKADIENLRRMASGVFLSANREGVYVYDDGTQGTAPAETSRAMKF